MAVTFERHGQLHYLDPGEERYRIGDWVLFPTAQGPEVAHVVWAPEPVDDHLTETTLPRCGGRASQTDLERDAAQRSRRAEVQAVASALAEHHGLSLTVLAVDVVDRGDDPHVAVYYAAPERIDFRALLPDLARAAGARIDLRHVGARERARIVGGVGNCGRELCCSTFLKDLEPIATRLARVQNLPSNPLQISGACGRLMCCLKYEHPLYVDFARRAPSVGDTVTTPEGDGVVVAHQVPTESVMVRTGDGEVRRCPLASVCTSHKARDARTTELAAGNAPAVAAPGDEP